MFLLAPACSAAQVVCLRVCPSTLRPQLTLRTLLPRPLPARSTFQQHLYTEQRNHFYEEKGVEAEKAAAAAAAVAAAAAKAAEEEAAAERAARKKRMIEARAAAKKAWEEAQAAAAKHAAAQAAAQAAAEATPDTPPPKGAPAAAAAAAQPTPEAAPAPAAAPASFLAAPLDLEALSDSQLAAELHRLELETRRRAAARLGAALADSGSAAQLAEASGAASSLSSSAAATMAAGTPQATPADAGAPARAPLDSSRLRKQLQHEALLLEAAAAAAAADSAAAAAAAAEAAAAALEAEEAAAAADAAAADKAAADPDLQRVFAAFAAFGKNAELRGELRFGRLHAQLPLLFKLPQGSHPLVSCPQPHLAGTAAAAPLLDSQQASVLLTALA